MPILPVLEPEPIAVPEFLELIFYDGPEERTRVTGGLEHAAHVEVDLPHAVAAVEALQAPEQVGVLLEQLGVDVGPIEQLNTPNVAHN